MSFKDLGLSAELLRTLEARGYTVPTPVQAQAIPALLAGHDVLAGAQTGTGKTAAFALPILQMLPLKEEGKRPRNPRALILVPTRELAMQVSESFQTYGNNTQLRITLVYGGVGLGGQAQQLQRGTDIVVATPGRLMDHMERGNVRLSAVKMFVLDEADRMLDMGFINDIRRISAQLPRERQNMMFSATYSDPIRRLSESILINPKTIEVAPANTAAERVLQIAHPVNANHKQAALQHLITAGNWQRVLVFTRTKHRADRVARDLHRSGVRAVAIHGDKTQGARTKALDDFKRGKIHVLVATDVASRGLDIDTLPVVVNFDLPDSPEDYIHRIGRTGRAGNDGMACSLVCFEQDSCLRAIEKLLSTRMEIREIPGYQREVPYISEKDRVPPAARMRSRRGRPSPSRSNSRW